MARKGEGGGGGGITPGRNMTRRSFGVGRLEFGHYGACFLQVFRCKLEVWPHGFTCEWDVKTLVPPLVIFYFSLFCLGLQTIKPPSSKQLK